MSILNNLACAFVLAAAIVISIGLLALIVQMIAGLIFKKIETNNKFYKKLCKNQAIMINKLVERK